YGDLRDKDKTEAVFSIQVFVTHMGNPDRAIVLQRTYDQRVRVADRSADAITKGLSEALQQSLAHLEAALRALQRTPSTGCSWISLTKRWQRVMGRIRGRASAASAALARTGRAVGSVRNSGAPDTPAAAPAGKWADMTAHSGAGS